MKTPSASALIGLVSLLSLVASTVTGCAADVSADEPIADDEAALALRISNPVLKSCYDGAPLRHGNDFYVVCAGTDGGKYFPIYKSRDMLTFTRAGEVLAAGTLPAWAHGGGSPELHHVAGGFAAVWSSDFVKQAPGRPDITPNGKRAIAIAFSSKIEGPYADELRAPLAYAPARSTIDAHIFAEGTSLHLFYKEEVEKGGKDADRIVAVKLSDDAHRTEGLPRVVLDATQPITSSWEHGVVEAPFVRKHGDYYYLFFSGNHYCNANYGVGVARSKTLLGSYDAERLDHPILAKGSRWVGPGHQGIVTGPDGRDWIQYHAYDLRDGTPACDAKTPGDNNARKALVDRISWQDGWPRVESKL